MTDTQSKRIYGRYTDSDIFDEAKKFTILSEFRLKSPKIYKAASRRNLLSMIRPKLLTFGTKKFKYTDDDIRKDGALYTTPKKWRENSPLLYASARNRKSLYLEIKNSMLNGSKSEK